MSDIRISEIVYGQEKAVSNFCSALSSGNLHHAWLLVGERGTGKATFAHAAARTLLSSTSFTSAHPDLFLLKPEDDSDVIKVDATRELTNFSSLTPALGERKVIIIDSVDELNDNAANALLKLLEEPQDNTFFFLVCHSLSRILPTIRSRCRLLRFLPLTITDFLKILKVSPEFGQELYKITNGSIYYSKLLLEEGAFDIYRLAEDLILAEKHDVFKKQKLMSAVSDDNNWRVIRFALNNVINNLIKSTALGKSLTEKQLYFYTKRLELIQKSDFFHLDRSQLIAAIL